MSVVLPRDLWLVEDDADVADLLLDLIARWWPESNCLWLDHGTRAVERLQNTGDRAGLPEVLLLDLNLPGHHGLEILKVARDMGLELPVIVLTSSPAHEDREASLAAGADGYLCKSYPFDDVREIVMTLLAGGEPR